MEIVSVEMMAYSKVELWGDKLAEGSVVPMVGSTAVKIWKQRKINTALIKPTHFLPLKAEV